MSTMYIYILSTIIVLFVILYFTCNFLNIPYYVYKSVDMLLHVPFYIYFFTVLAAIAYYKLVHMRNYIVTGSIYIGISTVFIMYILAYFISTPQIYM